MILHHIPDCPTVIIIRSPLAHSNRFSNSDLNMVNRGIIPLRFKNDISEPQRHKILNGFFSQIMINRKSAFHQTHLVIQRQLLLQTHNHDPVVFQPPNGFAAVQPQLISTADS